MAETIHDKAIRLIEGGIVEVDGLCVAMRHEPDIFTPCSLCEMDSLCHRGSDILNLCEECDAITKEDCYLVLADKNDTIKQTDLR